MFRRDCTRLPEKTSLVDSDCFKLNLLQSSHRLTQMPRVICAIGCGTFQDKKLDPLPGALDDAKGMFSLLTNLSLGAADANEPPSKLVLDPTQDEILSALES